MNKLWTMLLVLLAACGSTGVSTGADEASAATLRIAEQGTDAERLEAAFDGVRRGDRAGLEALLARPLDLDATNARGDTLLILAAYYGHPELVGLLLDAGATPDLVSATGMTALHAATFQCGPATVVRLLDLGAAIDRGSSMGTPLMVAAEYGRPELVELLLARGADASRTDVWGRTARDRALVAGNMQIVAVLDAVTGG
jgi:ankyrin repeat protein